MTKLATMTSVCPDWSLDELVAGMNRHGYQGVEPRVEWGHASGIEKDLTAPARADVRRRFDDDGLSICCLATGVRMATPDADTRDGHVEDLRRYIELAADLGCPLIRTFGGPRDASAPWAMVVDYTAEGYRQVLDDAEGAGVTVLMETHDDWCCSAPVRAVVEAVDHKRLRVLWDFMHTQRMMEKPAESFQALGHLTRHIHAHDGSYINRQMQVSATLGEGIIDHATPLQLLEKDGFDGHFSVEVIHKPGSDHDADGVLASYAAGFHSYH